MNKYEEKAKTMTVAELEWSIRDVKEAIGNFPNGEASPEAMRKWWDEYDAYTVELYNRMKANKPRFDSKEECEAEIKNNPLYSGCCPTFVGERYAAVMGLKRGGWYLYSRNKSWFALD